VLDVADGRVEREGTISQLLKRRRNVRRGHLLVFYVFSGARSGRGPRWHDSRYNGYQ
jgi:hypothetical protein